MAILQIIFALGSLGIIGFILYWVAMLFGVAPKATQDEINNNPDLKI